MWCTRCSSAAVPVRLKASYCRVPGEGARGVEARRLEERGHAPSDLRRAQRRGSKDDMIKGTIHLRMSPRTRVRVCWGLRRGSPGEMIKGTIHVRMSPCRLYITLLTEGRALACHS
jgi:hypothetical protein